MTGLSHRTWRGLAADADRLAGVASGQGWYALSSSLYSFEAHLEEKAKEALVQRRDEILAKPADDQGWSLYSREEIALLRQRQLLTREQYLQLARDFVGEEMGT